jgi:hypothetical protein
MGLAHRVDNTFKNNTVLDNGVVDVLDITKGKKTEGTANTWTNNACVTGTPSGLCIGREV